jgi:peptidoglycan/xylan/chitin deacetylase (PgdA/CDA1 family)
MEVLRTKATPVTLGDLVHGVGTGAARVGSIAVTFDDGYADVALTAKSVLQRYEIPATVFVVSGFLGRRFWWDELTDLIHDAPRTADGVVVQPAPQFKVQLDLTSSTARFETLDTLYQHLLRLNEPSRREVLDELGEVTGVAHAVNGAETMSDEDVARLASTDLFTVGSHAASHTPLGNLSDRDQLTELCESRRHLERITGRPVEGLSYPHGSIGANTAQLAHQAGYRWACSSVPDVARPRGDLYCLPRFWIPDWDGERFSRWLSWWKR